MAAPPCGPEVTQLLLSHLWEAAPEAAQTQLPEQRGFEQCHCSAIHGPVQGQGPALSCVLGAAASHCCVHSGEQLHFAFLTGYVVWEEFFLLYTRGTLA